MQKASHDFESNTTMDKNISQEEILLKVRKSLQLKKNMVEESKAIIDSLKAELQTTGKIACLM